MVFAISSPLQLTNSLNPTISTNKLTSKSQLTCHFINPNTKIFNLRLHPLCIKCSSCSSDSPAFNNDVPNQDHSIMEQENLGFWDKWKAKSAEMSRKLAKLGLAAVLAYGLFDGVTYTTFFVLAFLGYEKSTGNNPAANIKALIGIVLLMWTGNNVTRPFRVAGAAALAPAIDKGLKKIQKDLNLPSLVYAFALVAGLVATSCAIVVGLLILSRWGK